MAALQPSPHRSYSSNASVSYETFAPRSTAQVSRLSRIAALTTGPSSQVSSSNEQSQHNSNLRPQSNMLMEVMTSPSQYITSVVSAAPQKYDDTDYDLNNREAVTADSSMVSSTLTETNDVVEQLHSHLKHTTSLRLALRASINIAEDISNRHAELIRHSGELSAAADRLQEEEKLLTRHAEEIGLPLLHYDAVDRIGIIVGVLFKGASTVRGLAKIKVDGDDFPDVLDDIDKAVVFFGKECGGKDALHAEMARISKNKKLHMTSGSIEYYRRALALQEAALDLIKEAVAERITTTTSQIAGALHIAKGNTVRADQLEASLIYTRFHGISSRSNRLLSLVRERLHQRDDSGVGDAYSELLQHCRQTYCSCRESLLRKTVSAHMDQLNEQHGAVGMTRLASVFLIRLCTQETALYLDFFGDTSTNYSKTDSKDPAVTTAPITQKQDCVGVSKDLEFQAYLTSLCSALHRTVRRSLVTMVDLDTLCQIVSVLREERSMASATPTTMAAARAISSVIQDSQERLIFCANSTLSREVMKFKPTATDLDYPNKLHRKVETSKTEDATTTDDDAMERQLQQVYESWFPPMRTVLKILSKIFRVVESKVFEDIALSSIQACTKCLKEGAMDIRSKQGQVHADLFLVKHLLILREQLSPFDIELRSVEKQLDFSEAGKAVARFLANRNRRIFSVSTENALVTLLREGISVQESAVDSKRDLEDALRSACNDFIEHTSLQIAEDLLAIVEAYKISDSTSEHNDLCQADHVLGVLRQLSDSLEPSVAAITLQMSLYLDNPATQTILLKPVSRKVTRALDDLRKLAVKIENREYGWDDENRPQVTELSHLLEQAMKAATKLAK